jgi:hypothetical protein
LFKRRGFFPMTPELMRDARESLCGCETAVRYQPFK